MAKKIEKNKTKSGSKKNVIVSYNRIDNALKLELIKKYPEGYGNFIVRYPKPNGEYFFAVPLETKDANYLIKVEVKIDTVITEDEFDKHFGDVVSEEDSKVIREATAPDAEDTDDDEDEMDDNDVDNDDDDDDE